MTEQWKPPEAKTPAELAARTATIATCVHVIAGVALAVGIGLAVTPLAGIATMFILSAAWVYKARYDAQLEKDKMRSVIRQGMEQEYKPKPTQGEY